jgi:hypothetical protein
MGRLSALQIEAEDFRARALFREMLLRRYLEWQSIDIFPRLEDLSIQRKNQARIIPANISI